jgi:anti-sigma B factor antagonist
MAIAVIEKQGTVLTVRPQGRVDTVRTPLLDRELQPYLDGVQLIVMDFSEVEYISSSGLRLLLWLEQMTEERGGEVQLIHANEAVMKIIKLSGFVNAIHVIPD